MYIDFIVAQPAGTYVALGEYQAIDRLSTNHPKRDCGSAISIQSPEMKQLCNCLRVPNCIRSRSESTLKQPHSPERQQKSIAAESSFRRSFSSLLLATKTTTS